MGTQSLLPLSVLSVSSQCPLSVLSVSSQCPLSVLSERQPQEMHEHDVQQEPEPNHRSSLQMHARAIEKTRDAQERGDRSAGTDAPIDFNRPRRGVNAPSAFPPVMIAPSMSNPTSSFFLLPYTAPPPPSTARSPLPPVAPRPRRWEMSRGAAAIAAACCACAWACAADCCACAVSARAAFRAV